MLVSLRRLTELLAAHHGERVVILIDEYDIPIQAGFSNGFYDEITTFFRNFLGAALKDNQHLFRGALTGVLRVAKESIFSGLNNVEVHSVLSRRFCSAFGFTEPEIAALAEAMGSPGAAAEIARWYNGYRFGETTIYNPWSVLSYAATPENGLRPYWVFTSSNDVLRSMVFEQPAAMAADVEALLKGETLTRTVTEHLVLRELDEATDETVDQALAAALQQIADRGYIEELTARQAAPILTWGVVFDGKRVWVRKG